MLLLFIVLIITCRNEEIVMPAEQVGLVRDNYLWKVKLKKKCCSCFSYFC